MTMPLMPPPRKNPISRTPQLNLPPAARGRVALGVTAAATQGRFELQACKDCGAVQYPPREACQKCLSPRLRWAQQTGEGALLGSTTLHHSNDLYWEWSTEYVFLKMAGTSPQTGPNRALTFDIGGANAARTVAPAFGTNVLAVKDGHVPEIHMYVNVRALFESTTPANRINFATTYSVESGSPWAPVMADNLAAGMFTIGHVHSN